ncbi:iron uptake transporter deferrochelatase/peroxidase subunit [Cryptosporangium phraense]|uniref:Deferrochelatase n=1 Tax=Cryptosporangium phraense TaxID=2593070 RepID=A0A545AYQ3_9ACTN|nr:iron uptake transporter deferrochelatase/peroxidase subunit [Cryptosporangium phraense]TQS46472.1 deferrochelatase/peroxidase EfeB [Cryptosporangium phraense]
MDASEGRGAAGPAAEVSEAAAPPSEAPPIKPPADAPPRRGFSRRRLLGAGAVGIAGLGAAAAGGYVVSDARSGARSGGSDTAAAIPFRGTHQAGIVTPAQDRLHFVSFDVTTESRADLVDLLREWTKAAERMTAGEAAGALGAVDGPIEAPPQDTGEALGLPASQLTLTIGFGPSLFDRRFGLAAKRPAALVDLPAFPGDDLEAARSGGDIAIQACANDPQVAVHAVRNLARIGFGAVAVRWSQLGFGRTSSTSRGQATPRNLFGFKDGTANLKAEDASLLEQQLWAGAADGTPWMANGSYLVARRIRMHIETWDRTSLDEQQAIFGRFKGTGAPKTSADADSAEFDDFEFDTVTGASEPVIADNAHTRLAHPDFNQGARLLRRGYNFVDGSDGLGRLDAGLFFLAYQRDPRKQFIPIQQNLARVDAMNEYVKHVGSAVFACPPGLSRDGYWGDTLFA